MTTHKTASITDFSRIFRAFRHAGAGFQSIFATEAAFRQELLIAVIAIPLALWLPVSYLAKAVMVSTVMFILFAEMVNTAIETIVDKVSPEQDPLAKIAKDIGSAFVLLSFVNAGVVWLIMLIGLVLA